MNNQIAVRKSASDLVTIYQAAEKEIREAYQLLEKAKSRLTEGFLDNGVYFDTNPRDNYYVGTKGAEITLNAIQRRAWQCIIDKIGVKQLLSVRRREDLEKQLSSAKDLPPITEQAIFDLLDATLEKIDIYINEAIKEVYDFLRPQNSRLKSNSKFEVKKKVILTHTVEAIYPPRFRVIYGAEPRLNALDNVFMRLDGKGTVKDYKGPLCQAIELAQDGSGETEYFKFKCCLNGNLHIIFKRISLLNELNKVAGGSSLK